MEIRQCHQDRALGRRVVGAAGLEQGDDLAAAAAGALDDGVQLVLADAALLDKRRQRQAADRWEYRTMGTISSP